MSDYFKEQIIKKNGSTTGNALIYALAGLGGFLALISLVFIPIVGFIVATGIIIGMYCLVISKNKEFEYIVTNYDFDIDVITNRSKRKRAFSLDIRTIKYMAYDSNKSAENEFRNAKKVLDFSSGTLDESTMNILVDKDGVETKIIIQPNEHILDGFRKFLNIRVLNLNR